MSSWRLSRLVPAPTVLDRELYKVTVPVLGTRISAQQLSEFRSQLSKDAWIGIPRMKAVVEDPEGSKDVRGFLLNPLKFQQEADLDQDAETKKIVTGCTLGFFEHRLVLDYDYWQAEDILTASLPEGMEVPSSFEVVGHLAHLNLRDEHRPYKFLIGQVILDKNKMLRTVVSKVGTIDTTFRFFQMELLAGEDDYMVEVRQSGCRFRFDYSKVYWNSRLQHEHERLVSMIGKGEYVCDVFCGVGPFAVPAAKKGAVVYANDLNPESFKALKENMELNKVMLKTFNMDGREVILRSRNLLADKQVFFNHYIMNLPALAVTFCSAFDEIADEFRQHWHKINVHIYLFVRPGEEPAGLLKEHLRHPHTVDNVHMVRTVAPNKDMYCISFRLCDSDVSDKDGSIAKRVKTGE